MLRVQAQDSIGSIVIGCRDGGKGGGVIFMSLLFLMFLNILDTFVFGYLIGGKK